MSPNFNFSTFNVTELLLKNGVEIELQKTLKNECTRIRLICSSMLWKLNILPEGLHVKNCNAVQLAALKFFCAL